MSPTPQFPDATAAPGRIVHSVENGVGWIVLDNPGKLNAISESMWRGVLSALSGFESDPSVRCVVFRGAGERAFCAGADLSEKAAEAASGEPVEGAHVETLARIQSFPKPTLAMIAGHCFGAGVAISLACDLRIAGADARLCIPAARLGLVYFRAGLKRLADIVGPSRAKRIVFTGDRYTAEQAQRLGLLDEVVPAADLQGLVTELAVRIAANAPLTLRAAKLAIDSSRADGASASEIAACDAMERAALSSEDLAEGLRAFREKRPPVFRDR